MQELKQRVVLITGAGRGIGKRLAIGFANAGARVGLVARSRGEVDLAQLEIAHAGGIAMKLVADVCDYEALSAAHERLQREFGPVDTLLCAAAVQGPIAPFAESDPRQWAETIQINLIGVMHACRVVLAGMIERRWGKIIVLSGGGASNPRPNFSSYAASKAALARFVETIAQEVQSHNVQVNCMAPGGTYTNMTDEILQAGDRAGEREHEDAVQVRLTGGITPERQTQLALFLASERSNHLNGKLIHVNDDWRKLEQTRVNQEMYTLRRVLKVQAS